MVRQEFLHCLNAASGGTRHILVFNLLSWLKQLYGEGDKGKDEALERVGGQKRRL